MNMTNEMESRIIPFPVLCLPPPRGLPCPSSSNCEPAKPRKKRSKLIKLGVGGQTILCSNPSRRKHSKKPDPLAPKITEPCSECGKKFWSPKALFGHMRCHPERQWRGINPPPNHRRSVQMISEQSWEEEIWLTEEEREVASCLMMLSKADEVMICSERRKYCEGGFEEENTVNNNSSSSNYYDYLSSSMSTRFECSSCKKVFGSHQALGGHRASHKNVKGCFAMMRIMGDYDDYGDDEKSVVEVDDSDDPKGKELVVWGGHKCSVCFRVFSTGQALGGHMRCHWENRPPGTQPPFALALDLNLPPPTSTTQRTHHSYSYSSTCTLFPNLDLRLRL